MVAAAEFDPSEDYFGRLRSGLRAVGLSVSPNLSFLYKVYSYALMFILSFYAFVMIPDLFNYHVELDVYIDAWLFATGYFAVLIKWFALFFNRKDLNIIMDALQSGVFLPSFERGGEVEINLIKECVALTNKLTMAGSVVGLGTMGVSAIGAYVFYLSSGKKKLPFGSLDIVNNNYSFEAALFCNVFCFAVGVEAFMLVDIVYASILAHICVQCQMLQHFIRRATEISRTTMIEDGVSTSTENVDIPYKYLHENLKKMVLHHVAILKIGEDIESVFNIPTLCIFSEMSMCFCFIMYQGSLYPIVDLRFLKDFLVLITAILPLLINCYWGSEVLFESQGIANACYEIDFVGTDVRFQKSLILMIERSQKPIKLTVGKFAVLSLVTMVAVLRLSYSYFMLLRKVNSG